MPDDDFDRTQMIDWVMDQYYRLNPGQDKKYGGRGRQACREDIAHHWAYLSDAAAVDQPEIFVNYAVWLLSVLVDRGLEARHLDSSLALMEEYLRKQPDLTSPANRRELLGILAQGRHALQAPLVRTDPYAPGSLEAARTASLVDALCVGDRHAARSALFAGQSGGQNFLDLAVGTIQPALYEIGYRWQKNRLSVAQEHIATAICQSLLTSIYADSEFSAPREDRRAILACVEGNHHSLGLRIVSDALEIAGWQVRYIGADTPSQALLGEISAWRPQLLALSLSIPNQISAARRLIAQVKTDLAARRPEIAAGGLVINSAPGLWKTLGADHSFSDARQAVESLR